MANISLDFSNNALFQKNKITKTYTYKDIGTDNLKLYKVKNQQTGIIQTKLYDKNTSNIDLNAIKAALRNLFSFRTGQEILQPEFGNELYDFMYQPINEIMGQKISRTIQDMVERWQPRVRTEQVKIEMDIDNLAYYITYEYSVPSLNTRDSLALTLNRNKLSFN